MIFITFKNRTVLITNFEKMFLQEKSIVIFDRVTSSEVVAYNLSFATNNERSQAYSKLINSMNFKGYKQVKIEVNLDTINTEFNIYE